MKSFFPRLLIVTLLSLLLWTGFDPLQAKASLNDDRNDGGIFVLYAGNGSLVPPKLNLQETLNRKIPAIIVYYLDDSRDCKDYAVIVSRLQEFYGRAASIIPVNVDSIPVKTKYQPNEVGYYYQGYVPYTIILDEEGKKVFEVKGNVEYTVVDDRLREVFDLLPRTESEKLKRRAFNEYNTELVEQK